LSKAEDAFSSGRVQPFFGQRRQHHGDLVGGRFQPVQGRVMSSAERDAARLTAKGLDALGSPMLAISDERMNRSLSDPAVPALRVGTSEPLGIYAFGGSPAAFDLAPGAYRRRCISHKRRVDGGDTTGMAVKWGSWLEETLNCGADSPSSWMGRLMREPAKTPTKRQTE
jgi:hypothetical protein